MNRFLQELTAWLDSDRLGRKVLLCGSVAAGNQLLRMAAAHGTSAVNVEAVSVRDWMVRLADPVLAQRGLRRADHITEALALRRIMAGLGDAFTTLGEVEPETAESVLGQLAELERDGVTPEALAGVGEALLAEAWRAFMAWRRDNGYASEAQILEAAAAPEGVACAVMSNLRLTRLERQFLEGLPRQRLTVIHLLTPQGDPPPRNAALQSPEPCAGEAPVPPCVDCQDIGTEIRWAFQHLIEAGIPAEQAVIVCPDETYGQRVVDGGWLLGMVVDSAFGTPADMTRPALLLRCLSDWAEQNYDVEALTPALIGGAMALYNERGESVANGWSMLRAFRTKRVGWGAERWAAMAGAGDSADAACALMSDWVRFFEEGPRPVKALAMELKGLLGRCMRQSRENAIFLNAVDEIGRVYGDAMRGGPFLSLVRSVASAQRLDTHTAEQPGHVYCCGYEDALYVDRLHFLMLGMSWDAFDRLGREFPLLSDGEKARLSPGLRLVDDGPRQRRYAVRELLVNRADAHVVFSRARMDRVGGEELMAASIYEDAARRYPDGRAPRIDILNRRPLTELDARLRAGFWPRDEERATDEGRERGWAEAFEGRVWSATALETAYACPRWFTLSEQMYVREERPQPLTQYGPTWLSGPDRGNVIHRVLESYFRKTAPRVDRADEALLKRLVEENIERARATIPVPSNLTDVSGEAEDILAVVTQVARAHAEDPGRRTMGAEIDFGGDDAPLELTFGPHTIRLRGRIDRVDALADGYEVVDYKSGRPRAFREGLEGKLQHYLYTLAWEKLHPDKPVRRAAYDLVDGVGGVERITLEMTEEVRREMAQKLADLLERMADPVLAGMGREDVWEGATCPGYCPYQAICSNIRFPAPPEEFFGGDDFE